MVAEGGTAVAVQTELVLVARVLGSREDSFRDVGDRRKEPKTLREVAFTTIFFFFCICVSACECSCK